MEYKLGLILPKRPDIKSIQKDKFKITTGMGIDETRMGIDKTVRDFKITTGQGIREDLPFINLPRDLPRDLPFISSSGRFQRRITNF